LSIPFEKENSEDVGAKTLGFPKVVADQASESISFGIEKTDSMTQAQTIQGTSATDCDISEPRLVTALVEMVEGLQQHLQALSKGIKEITRSKRWAQKAYQRRERRRAEKQRIVVYQPQFPANHPQKPVIVDGNWNKAEEGSQSPQDWEPSKVEEARIVKVDFKVSQQLSGSGLDDTQTLSSQIGSNREDLVVLGRTPVNTGPQVLAARPVRRWAPPGARYFSCSPHGPARNGQRQANLRQAEEPDEKKDSKPIVNI
jgi:hypothetical protein